MSKNTSKQGTNMSTSRRSFIKQSVSAASAGLVLSKVRGAAEGATCNCVQRSLPDPDIRVLLSGLFLYRFAAGDAYCDINPLRNADDHFFSVVVKARKGNGVPYTLWRYFDEPTRLTLSLDGAPSAVKKHQVGKDFNRNATGNDCMDWRWILRLEEFEKPKSTPDNRKLWPALTVKNGEFYTAIKTDPAQTTISCECKSGPEELCSIGSVVGINISFGQFEKAFLEGVPDEPVEMTNGLKYEIYFDFDPRKPISPTLFTKDGVTSFKYPTHFHKYFDAMRDSKQMCDITYSRTRATPDVPCMGLEG